MPDRYPKALAGQPQRPRREASQADISIEIGASTVVIWELSGTGEERQRRGLRLIGYAFAALAVYLLVQSTGDAGWGLSPASLGRRIIWTAVTAAVMFAQATAVLLGVALNTAWGWWWADPAARYVMVLYAAREVREILFAPK